MFIRTVENWEVAYSYGENEASIFDAKIQGNLFSAKHASWAPSREMKSVTLLKRNG